MFTTRRAPLATTTASTSTVNARSAPPALDGCLTLGQLAQALDWPVPALVQLMQRIDPTVALSYEGSGGTSLFVGAGLPFALRPISPERVGFYQQVAQRLGHGESLNAILAAPPVVSLAKVSRERLPAGTLQTQAALWGFEQYCSLLYRLSPSASLAKLSSSVSAKEGQAHRAVFKADQPTLPVIKGRTPFSTQIVGIAHQDRPVSFGLSR
jgi:hypothetical protein